MSSALTQFWRQGVRHLGRPLATFALGGSSKQSRPKQKGLVGVFTGLGGVVYANNEQGIERKLHRRIPTTVIPESIGMLVENNISVPPSVLLDSLPWGALDQPEALEQRSRIERWKERGHNVDPSTATEICRKFASWFALHELQQIQEAHSTVSGALDEVLQQTGMSLKEVVSSGISSIQRTQAAGDVARAAQLAETQIQLLDRIHDVLDDARNRLVAAEEQVCRNIINYLKIAGGCAVIFLCFDFIGTLPAGVDLAACEWAIDNGLIALSGGAVEFLLSPSFQEYRDQVTEMQTSRSLAALKCSRLQMLLEQDKLSCL